MKRSTILVAIAVAVMTAALTAQAGAVPGPVAQQETPTANETPTEEPLTPTDGTPAGETPANETPANEPPADEPGAAENETPTETPEEGVGVSEDNETTGNETTDGPSLTFEDQESNGTAVTVSNVTLDQPGYVVIHDDSLASGQAVDSVIGVSDYLPAGTYDNVTVTLFDVPGANYTEEGDQTADPIANESANETDNETTAVADPSLEGTVELTAMLHSESSVDMMAEDDQTMGAENQTPAEGMQTPTADNESMAGQNQTFDFVDSVGLLDPPVEVNGTAVTDTANVTVVEEDTNETGVTETETGTTTETETGTTTETETGTTTGTETGTEPAPAEGTATPTQTA